MQNVDASLEIFALTLSGALYNFSTFLVKRKKLETEGGIENFEKIREP